jgi:hypothetical protein
LARPLPLGNNTTPENDIVNDMDTILVLGHHTITVTLDGEGGGRVSSNLLPGDPCCDERASVDAIESVVLAHACAGVEIDTPRYKAGLEGAIDSLGLYVY